MNSEFHYDRYFSIIPAGGPHPKEASRRASSRVAETLTTRSRRRIALVGADAEFPKNALDGARAQAKRAGYKIVYDQTYPPTTADYTPIVRAIQATNADLVLVCSYPPDTVGMIHAANEIGLKTQLFGGGMVGLQATAIKTQLGPLINGIVDYDFWLPVGRMPPRRRRMDFLKKYQAHAATPGKIDLLGYYLPPFAYADMQVLGRRWRASAAWTRRSSPTTCAATRFHTVVGDIKFGPNGEWTEARTAGSAIPGGQGRWA